MAATETTDRNPSMEVDEKEKIEIEQREHNESTPTAEEIEFRKQERKVVTKLDLVRLITPALPCTLTIEHAVRVPNPHSLTTHLIS
jgi:hypothetical protein